MLTSIMQLALDTFTVDKRDAIEEESLRELQSELKLIVSSQDSQRILFTESILESTPYANPGHSMILVQKANRLYTNATLDERNYLTDIGGVITKKFPDWDSEIFQDTVTHRKLYGEETARKILDCAVKMNDNDFRIFSDEAIEKTFPLNPYIDTTGIDFDKLTLEKWTQIKAEQEEKFHNNSEKRDSMRNMQFSPYNQQTARKYTALLAGSVFGGDMSNHWRNTRMLDFVYNGPVTEHSNCGIRKLPPQIRVLGLQLKPEIASILSQQEYYKNAGTKDLDKQDFIYLIR